MNRSGRSFPGTSVVTLCLTALVMVFAGPAAGSSAADSTLQVFNAYSALARSDELLCRTLMPLEAQRVREAAEHSGKRLAEYGIDRNRWSC